MARRPIQYVGKNGGPSYMPQAQYAILRQYYFVSMKSQGVDQITAEEAL